MLYHMEQYISNDLTKVFHPALGQRMKFTGNTGMARISAANSNLNGTGTVVDVITGASNGTFIETITVKAVGNTTRGMVRLFLSDGATFTDLLAEIDIPAVVQSSIDQAFSTTLQVDFMLLSGYKIRAATQNAESFNVIAEGTDITYP